jgi:hypothetical protein
VNPHGTHAEFDILDRAHPKRADVERFVAARYASAYGARVEHFALYLAALRGSDGGWSASVGFTPAEAEPLFVEQYLDCPVEQAIAEKLGASLNRSDIVEVGNLAASGSGAARAVIVFMTRLLHELRRDWVVFTSTRALLNSFARLGIETVALAAADASRLPDGGASWGTYYMTRPNVMIGNVPLGLARLEAGRARCPGERCEMRA